MKTSSFHSCLRPKLSSILLSLSFWSLMVANAGNNFYKEVDITWGGDDEHGKILDNGRMLTLSLDKFSGSAFRSKAQYLYGKFDIKIKLVPGNSAGIVTAYYLRSEGSKWDEIDIEFLGNLSGDPYILHTNVYTQGKGEREEQFYLWFDPTADFHSYSILWNPLHIVWYVDGRPIREFKKIKSTEIPYPNDQPMSLHASLWNADDWATRGGTVKTNWTESPFTSSFKSFKPAGCVWSSGESSCDKSNTSTSPWFSQELDSSSLRRLKWVRNNYLVYDYCTDFNRFPGGLPLECTQLST